MTGFRSKHFREVCSEKGCYIERLPWWDDLIDCFPGKVMPTDIDAVVEMNGHFLFLEEKRAGNTMPEGQARLFRELSKLAPVAVICFRPVAGESGDMEVLHLDGGRRNGWERCSRDELRRRLREWSREVAPEKVAAHEAQQAHMAAYRERVARRRPAP